MNNWHTIYSYTITTSHNYGLQNNVRAKRYIGFLYKNMNIRIKHCGQDATNQNMIVSKIIKTAINYVAMLEGKGDSVCTVIEQHTDIVFVQ